MFSLHEPFVLSFATEFALSFGDEHIVSTVKC